LVSLRVSPAAALKMSFYFRFWELLANFRERNLTPTPAELVEQASNFCTDRWGLVVSETSNTLFAVLVLEAAAGVV